MLDLKCLPCVTVKNRSELPYISAIYFVFTEEYKLLYIGQTKNLAVRFNNHHRIKQFENCLIAWLFTNPTELIDTEQKFIDSLNPVLNGKKYLKDKGMCTVRLNLPCGLRDRFKASLAFQGQNMTDKLITMIEEYIDMKENQSIVNIQTDKK